MSPHVVVVVGLECINDLWGYAVEPLMLDRSKVRFQTKRDTGFYDVRESRFASGTRRLIRRVQANQRRRNSGRGPHLFKKG